MFEIKIPKDITKVETKFIGPFTGRQSFCLAGAAVTSILLYNIFEAFLPSTGFYACVLAAIPFGAVGWFKPYGEPFEKFIGSYIRNVFLAPSKRKYETNNIYSDIKLLCDEDEDETTPVPPKKKKKYKPSKEGFR